MSKVRRNKEVDLLEVNFSLAAKELLCVLQHPLVKLVDDCDINSVLNNYEAICEEGLNSIIQVLVAHDTAVALLVGQLDADRRIVVI